MVAVVYGARARFCDAGCRDSFREDRRRGLIYGAVLIDGVLVAPEEASLRLHYCVYCTTPQGVAGVKIVAQERHGARVVNDPRQGGL